MFPAAFVQGIVQFLKQVFLLFRKIHGRLYINFTVEISNMAVTYIPNSLAAQAKYLP